LNVEKMNMKSNYKFQIAGSDGGTSVSNGKSILAVDSQVISLEKFRLLRSGREDRIRLDGKYFEQNKLFGSYRISVLRDMLGVSVVQLADALGISADTLRSYECGRLRLPASARHAMERFLREEVDANIVCR
jgi:DNA-binding transcriptional regulator YiaG